MRVARLIEDSDLLRLAVDLAEYGARLDLTYQYASEPPFRELYASSRLFFRAQLGANVEEAVSYFKQQAENADSEELGTGPAEVYVALLARLGRFQEAIIACRRFLPPGSATSGLAPSLMELAAAGEEYQRIAALFREGGDLVNYTAARIQGRLGAQ